MSSHLVLHLLLDSHILITTSEELLRKKADGSTSSNEYMRIDMGSVVYQNSKNNTVCVLMI
jgi:hypothetical protein